MSDRAGTGRTFWTALIGLMRSRPSYAERMGLGVVADFLVIMVGGLTLGVVLALLRPQDAEAAGTYRRVANRIVARLQHSSRPKRFRRSAGVESRT
jgi:hypothetical protein